MVFASVFLFAYIVIMFTLLFATFIIDSLRVHLYLLTALAIVKFSSLFCFFWCSFFYLHISQRFTYDAYFCITM